MIREMSLKQAMVTLSRIENELSSATMQFRRKYKNEIISVNTKPVDNTKRIEKAKELYSYIVSYVEDIHTLRQALNKANNEVNENGMTILEMVDRAKLMRNHRAFMINTLNDPEFVSENSMILEKGCLVNDFLENKLDLIIDAEIEKLSNEIDILNTKKMITVDLNN